jgi:integrase
MTYCLWGAAMPKLWERKINGANYFYVKINGRQICLGRERERAEIKYAKLITKHRTPDADGTVAVLLDRYLDWLKINRAARTYDFYRDPLLSFSGHVGPRLRVCDLKKYHVQTWLDTCYPKAADNYKYNLIRAVQRPFNWAVRDMDYLESSPIVGMKKPEQTPREVCITPAQWRVLLRKIPDQQFRDLLTFLWESGARPQEARIMEAKHVQGDVVTFERINSKGKQRRRKIYLNDKALKIVQRLVRKYPAGWLFRNLNGNAWTKDSIKCRFQRLTLPFKVSAYALRHSFATRAIQSEQLSTLEIAKLMGHRDTRMLETVYEHVSDSHLRKAARKLA